MSRRQPEPRDYWWRGDARPTSLADIVPENARRYPDRVALERRAGKVWQPVTSRALEAEVTQLALGFVAAGIEPGDRVALMADTRYEWTVADAALWACGAVTVPVYASSSADQLRWILEDSGAVACIFERAEFAGLVADDDRASLPALRHRWLIDGRPSDALLEGVAAAGGDEDRPELDRRRVALTRDSLATIIYTSGTTGRPKGCELSHGNFLEEVAAAMEGLLPVFSDQGASTLLFLPLAHVFGRMIQIAVLLAGIRTGHTDIGRITRDLPTFKPTFVLAVPRVFERILDGAERKARVAGKERIFALALATAIEYSQAIERGRPGLVLAARHAIFDRLVYRTIRQALGGELRWGISGGAGLGARLGHAFRGMGMPVLEGYGLTETTAAATVNTPAATRIGSVGRPLPGFEVQIAAGGEVLIRGPHVFGGYWRDERATLESFATGRWLHTGDLGTVDPEGYLTITGRLKEILVTSTGKNVSPAPLEEVLRAHRLVSQAVVIGDGEAQVAALITLDEEALGDWLDERGRPLVAPAELVHDAAIHEALQDAVDAANRTVSGAEAIGRFRVLPRDLTIEDGHLTPTLKIKRAAVMEAFADDVAVLYPSKLRVVSG